MQPRELEELLNSDEVNFFFLAIREENWLRPGKEAELDTGTLQRLVTFLLWLCNVAGRGPLNSALWKKYYYSAKFELAGSAS